MIKKLVFGHRLIRFVVTKDSKNNVAEFSCNSTYSS